jgi:hypothetical protein
VQEFVGLRIWFEQLSVTNPKGLCGALIFPMVIVIFPVLVAVNVVSEVEGTFTFPKFINGGLAESCGSGSDGGSIAEAFGLKPSIIIRAPIKQTFLNVILMPDLKT